MQPRITAIRETYPMESAGIRIDNTTTLQVKATTVLRFGPASSPRIEI